MPINKTRKEGDKGLVMRICELGSTVSLSKGMKQDRERHETIKKREQKRRDIDDINQFMATLAAICPEYYGEKVQ